MAQTSDYLFVGQVGDVATAGGSMAYYRLYLLDRPGGRFIGFQEIQAVDDAEALSQAHDLPGGEARELWCGKRKVRSFPAAGPSGT